MRRACPKGAVRGRRGKPGLRFRSSADVRLDPWPVLAALALDDGGFEGLLARRVERQWLARGVLSVRPVTSR